jgi:hypothetical protein
MLTFFDSVTKKTHRKLWVFLFGALLAFPGYAQQDSSAQIAQMLVLFPELDPLQSTPNSKVLEKLKRSQKKADWTKAHIPTLDSAISKRVAFQTQMFIKKLNVLLAKKSYIGAYSNDESFLKHLDSIGSSMSSYSVVFAQAQIQDSAIDVEAVRKKLALISEPATLKKKEQEGYLINIEQIANFGSWHPNYKAIVDVEINDVIGPIIDSLSGTSVLYKVLERTAILMSDSALNDYAKSQLEFSWQDYVYGQLESSPISNIQLQPCYFKYQIDGELLNESDTIAFIDSIAFTLRDLAWSQNVYERFVLSTNQDDFIVNLKNYISIPSILYQNPSIDFELENAVKPLLKELLENEYRGRVLYASIIDEEPIPEEDIKVYYDQNIERFSTFGECSYLVAFIHDPQSSEAAKTELLKLFKNGQYNGEMKIKGAGFTVKFESNYNLNQNSSKAPYLRSVELGTPVSIPEEGLKDKWFLVSQRSSGETFPLANVRDQIVSELKQKRIQQLEQNFID